MPGRTSAAPAGTTAPAAPALTARSRLRRALRDDTGSAVAEFPMLAALLVLFLIVVLQAALVMHVRNTTIDAAVQGARSGALVGSTTEAGAERTRTLLEDRYGEGFVTEVSAQRGADGVITVRVRTALPVLAWYGPPGVLELSGRAVDEDDVP